MREIVWRVFRHQRVDIVASDTAHDFRKTPIDLERFAVAESVVLDIHEGDGGVLWIGTDDGNLKYTRDQGQSWTEVSQNVPDLPDGIDRLMFELLTLTQTGKGIPVPIVLLDAPGDPFARERTAPGHFTASDAVTLCYQRPRVLPDWPYNLFCMIHGTDRNTVLQQIDALVGRHQLQQVPRDVLFSNRQFKQCGGRFADTRLAAGRG